MRSLETLRTHVSVSRSDEPGLLARRFKNAIDQLWSRSRLVRKIPGPVNKRLFLLGPDLIIWPETSQVSEEIFQRRTEGLNFLDLLKPHPGPGLQPVISDEVLNATNSYLELLLNPRIKEKLVQQVNPLTEVEFQSRLPGGRIHRKFFEFGFNRVIEAGGTAQIGVTVLDSTSRILFRRQVRENEARARSHLEMVSAVMRVGSPILLEFLDHAEAEMAENLRLLEVNQFGSPDSEPGEASSNYSERLLEKLCRSIHLVKGNAAMLRFSCFENLANQVEEKVAALRTADLASGADFLSIIAGLASLLDQVRMTRDLIQRLSVLRGVFGKWQTRRDAIDFTPLAGLAEDIAARNGKQVRVTLEIANDLGPLAYHLREPIHTMMIQLIRNAVIHGIELPSERLAKKKKRIGTIRVAANRAADQVLVLAVRDDGRGISYEQLRRRAVELGYASCEEIQEWTRQQLVDLLYRTGFTTLDRPTLDGGRGVGLGAVRNLATRYGGFLRVATQAGFFSEFRIELSFGNPSATPPTGAGPGKK